MKKILLIVGVILLGLAPHAFADGGFVPLAPIPGLTDVGGIISSATLATFLNNLYKYLIGIAATIAVVEIIWGGLEISTKDSVSQHSNGKERIQQAIFGLVLVLSPVLVFSIINPSILNLSLNLPPIKTLSTPTTTTAPEIPCTSNCDTGATGASVGTTAGTGMGLYACSGSDCSAATKTCESQTTSTVASAGGLYSAEPVCTTSGGGIDANAKPPCPTGETPAINCIFTQNQ